MLEIGTVTAFNDLQQSLMEMISTAIATAVQTALSRDQTKQLLEQAQILTEELQAREEALTESTSGRRSRAKL